MRENPDATRWHFDIYLPCYLFLYVFIFHDHASPRRFKAGNYTIRGDLTPAPPSTHRLLKAVGDSIGRCIRTCDVLARYGGDEFVIPMPHTGSEAARIAAERIRAAIHGSSFELNGQRTAASASIGIASYPEGVEPAANILEKADIALYRSKQSGRDRVSVYHRELEVVQALPDPASAAIPRRLRPSSAVS